jgi:Phage Tail Collar Domain
MIGEIRPFALGFAPKDWYVCDGSPLKNGPAERLTRVRQLDRRLVISRTRSNPPTDMLVVLGQN